MAEPGRAVAQQMAGTDGFSEMNRSLAMADDLGSNFVVQSNLEAPPKHESRSFNVHDIYGDLDRDEKGNVIVDTDKDKSGKPVNPRGYLLDKQTGDVIENQTGRKMFAASQMDERGEVPAPFSFEKYNFNPHYMMGDFDYSGTKPNLLQSQQGFYLDKRSRRVNKHGWLTMGTQGHLVDVSGHKKFDKTLLTRDEDLP